MLRENKAVTQTPSRSDEQTCLLIKTVNVNFPSQASVKAMLCANRPSNSNSLPPVNKSYIVFQELVRELKVGLPTVHPVGLVSRGNIMSQMSNIPCTLVVKEAVGALLKLLRDGLGLLVTLKPCLILLVESPALILQRFGSKILLICFLLVVEDIE